MATTRFHFQNPDTGNAATVIYTARTRCTTIQFPDGTTDDDKRVVEMFFQTKWENEDEVRRALRRVCADFTASEGR